MKKISMIALAGIVFAGAANAGLLDSLGLTKKSEPQTLAEACDTDEIKKICPEVLLGGMTITECLKENATNLSKQCAEYIKKSVANGGESLKAKLTDAKAAADAESDAAKAEREAKTAELKEAATETVENAKRTGGLLKSLF